MLPGEIESLRDALRASPDNLALRKLLASKLLLHGSHEEAEREYRDALARFPDDSDLKVGLARAYYQQDKNSHALVILEDLVKSPDPPAQAYLLHARLLLKVGDEEFARGQYRNAIETDPGVADSELAERLGVTADLDETEGRLRVGWEEAPELPEVHVERPEIAFKDVGGMEDLKEEIGLKIIYPLQHPEIYQAYGKETGGGILMYGPPGCGKTHLARATAGEIQAGFISVGINDVLDMWMGNSEQNLHELFEQARRSKPCVLFFDEVDALGASRSDMKSSGGRHLINQFLAELDGVNATNEGVLILAATNAPWHLDSAFRRPGRFDRILFVPPPDAAARSAILQIHCRSKPAGDVDCNHVGKKTRNFSGADLKGVIDVSVENKLREAIRTGKPQPITTKDLLVAAKSLRPTTQEWFATARNYALYSNQGGLYDDILKYLKLQ